MKVSLRVACALAASVFACATLLAQSGGDALYKTKCQSCHGAGGNPNPALAKSMGIKPANAPEIKKLSVAEIVATVKNGKGKMKPVGGLDDGQLKALAGYFKTLSK